MDSIVLIYKVLNRILIQLPRTSSSREIVYIKEILLFMLFSMNNV